MRRVAATRVYLSTEEFHTNHIVELFDSFVVNHYGLQSELPMTEWLGGIILITTAILTPIQIRLCTNIQAIYSLAQNTDHHSPRPQAYHISNVDILSAQLMPNSIITQLIDQE